MNIKEIIEAVKKYKSQREDLKLPALSRNYVATLDLILDLFKYLEYQEQWQVVLSLYDSKIHYGVDITKEHEKRMKEVLDEKHHDKLEKTLKALKDYNDWRKGKNTTMPPPPKITEALDVAIKNLKQSIQ